MNAMTQVSVIMGVYNCRDKKILSQAIYSILKQTYTNLEFLICDDGSTDNTYQYLEEFAKLDKRIILLKNSENQGLGASLNQCMKKAKGKYITRQDADDYSDLDRVRKQVEYLERHKEIDFVGSNLHYFNEEEIWGGYQLPEFPEKKDFLFTVPFIHAATTFRKEAFLRVGGYQTGKETYRCEDYDLYMTMYAAGMKGSNLQEYLYYVREDKESKKRRKYRYRLDEAKIRYFGYKKLELMPIGYLYAIKPLIVGIIPTNILAILQNKYYNRKGKKE